MRRLALVLASALAIVACGKEPAGTATFPLVPDSLEVRPTETELASYDSWRSALADGLGLPLVDVDDAELRAMYDAQWAKHVAWTAAGRS